MRKHLIFVLLGCLCFCLLAGCSDTSKDSSTSVDSITDERLQQYFQQTFDAAGNAWDTPEQLHTELSELASITAGVQALPDDLDTQYKEWRTAYIKEMFDSLKEDYTKIISERPLFDTINPGLCYANQIDLDNNGVSELILVTLSIVDYSADLIYDNHIVGNHIPAATIEVYGESQKHAVKYGECSFAWMDIMAGYIKLYQNGDHIYIGLSAEGEPFFSYRFYTVKDRELVLADHVSADDLESRQKGPASYSSYFRGCHGFEYGCDGEDDIQEITQEQYDAIRKKYEEKSTIAIKYLTDPTSIAYYPEIMDHGSLEDPIGKYMLQVKLNGSLVQLSEQPRIFYLYDIGDFVAYLPMQEALEKMGMTFFEESFFDDTSLIGISKQDAVCLEPMGRYYIIYINNKQTEVDASPESLQGMPFIPLSVLEKINGTQIEWNRASWTVEITSKFTENDKLSDAEISAMRDFTIQDAITTVRKNGYVPHYDETVLETFYSNRKKWWRFLVCPLGTPDDEDAIYNVDFYDCLIADVAHDGTIEVKNMQ